MTAVALTDNEFSQFQRFIYDAAGISMSNGKQALVSGRLAKRLAHHRLGSYGDYLQLFEAAARLGLDPRDCWYVGDDLRDIQAGKAAGMPTIAAGWGYCGQHKPLDWHFSAR